MRNLILLFWGLFAAATVYAQPSLSFVVASQSCSESIDSFQIAVTISTPSPNPTSVDINVAGGNAVYGTNFTYGPVTVTFPANTPYTQLFTVYVIDDSIMDGDKTVTFSLNNPTNSATIGSISQCTLTMIDADTPKLSVAPTTETQNENIGTINVPVTLNRGVRDTTRVQVNLVPTGTTAINGVDFVFTNTTLIWPPDSAGTIAAHIPIINNPFYEPQRTIEVILTNPTNGAILTDSTFTLTLRANSLDSAPGCSNLFISQYVHGSGGLQALQIFNPTSVAIDISVYSILVSANGGTTTTSFALTGNIQPRGIYVVANPAAPSNVLSLASATPAGFTFDGTEAVALLHNTDTIDVVGQLHTYPGPNGWPVGSGSTIGHTLIRNYYDNVGDTSWATAVLTWGVFPFDMTDSLAFHNADSCGASGPVATVRFLIASDTVPPSPVQPWTVMNVTAEVNNPSGYPVSYTIAFIDSASTAKKGLAYDCAYTNFTPVDGPGITDNVVPLYIMPNNLVAPVKKAVFELINLSPNLKRIADSIYTVYIVNPNIFTASFLGAGYTYPKGAGRVEIPLIINAYSPNPTTMDVSLSSGSAVAGTDFLFNDTTITFPAYSTDTQGVWVTVLNNNLYESNKQVNFNLSNVTNGALIGISAFTLTIVNNDSLASGIVPIESEDIEMFPNPSKNLLTIKTTEQLFDLKIVDLLGNTQMTLFKLDQGVHNLDVSRLASGIYFIKFKEDNKQITMRFAKAN